MYTYPLTKRNIGMSERIIIQQTADRIIHKRYIKNAATLIRTYTFVKYTYNIRGKMKNHLKAYTSRFDFVQ